MHVCDDRLFRSLCTQPLSEKCCTQPLYTAPVWERLYTASVHSPCICLLYRQVVVDFGTPKIPTREFIMHCKWEIPTTIFDHPITECVTPPNKRLCFAIMSGFPVDRLDCEAVNHVIVQLASNLTSSIGTFWKKNRLIKGKFLIDKVTRRNHLEVCDHQCYCWWICSVVC